MNNPVKCNESGAADRLLNAVRYQVPVVDKVLQSAGDCSVSEYLQQVCQISQQSYQPRSDIAEVIYEYVAPLLGEEVADRTAADFLRHPVALTTNHHGVDFFAQSVQGSLLFGLAKRQVEGVTTIPVFSCANIPLNNLTYPRGALLYGADSSNDGAWPLKLPFFASKLRRQLVARVKGLGVETLKSVQKRIKGEAQINSSLKAALNLLIDEDYLAEDVQKQQSYSAQSVILNQRIWSRLFCPFVKMPDLITIELEKLSEGLLLKDLESSSSLASLLFNDQMIGQLYQRLDKVPGCWDQKLLEKRWDNRRDTAQIQASGCGTFCFWGVDRRLCRIPLMLTEYEGKMVLCGCDDTGTEYRYSLEAGALSEAISEGSLLPSIFSCYLVIALARGVTCLGGYYQAEYLPMMQEGVSDLLMQAKEYQNASAVMDCITDGYLSGMQTIMLEQGQKLLPAGPLEMLASGSVSLAELSHISKISVFDAHIASLAETIPDVVAREQLENEWLSSLSLDLRESLSDNVVLRKLS